MNIKETIRAEIEFARSVYSNPKRVVHGVADAFRQDGRAAMCDDILKFIDTLPEQPEPPKIEIAEYYYHKGVYEGLSQGRADALKILEKFMKTKAEPVIVIKQPEQPVKSLPEWKWVKPDKQYPVGITREMDVNGDWQYCMSSGRLYESCQYLSLAELELKSVDAGPFPILEDENASDKKAAKEIVKTVHKEVTRQVKEMVKEQPASEGLEEEIKRFLSNATKMNKGEWRGKYPISDIGFRAVARHFAEWMKAKMLEEAVEGIAEELYNDGEIHCTVGVGTYFKPGDKVYVIKEDER